MMNAKLKFSLNLVLITFFLFILFGCGKQEKKAAVEEAIPVKVMKVELKTIQNTLDYVDDIKAQDEALIYPKVSGKIIEKIKQEGDAVNKGDVIAYIDRDEVGFKFEKAPVESPLTGVIGRINVDIGTQVTPQSPVALVVDMDKVKIDLDIPEGFLPKISIGQTAEVKVQAYPNEKFIGTVLRISPVLDLETRTAPIEITIPNLDHRLKSGMFAQAQLVIEEHKNVPVIMKEAILGRSPNEYAYIVNGDTAHLKNIKVGIHQGDYYEVLEGLEAGDSVVIMGQQRLHEMAPVLIEQDNNDVRDIRGEK